MVTWSCLGFSFALSIPTLTFLAWSLTEGSPSKIKCVVLLSPSSLEELIFWGLWSVSLWTPLCCLEASLLLCNCSHKSLSIVLRCGYLLLNVIFSLSSARGIRWPGFALIRLSCHCVIDVMLLHCVCCTRLIRTRIIVCPVSFLLLLSEFDIL